MSRINTGDLIYIPSEVTIYQTSEDLCVNAHKRISKPVNALVTKVRSKSYEIYFDSEYWLVDKMNVYSSKGEKT